VPVYKRFLIAASVLFGLACHSATESSGASSDLERNRQRWAGQNISRYEFTYDRLCFCVPVGPMRVTVRDGKVVAATIIATGESVDVRDVLTVDELFALIERGIKSHYSELRVKYDASLGYPTEIYSDQSYQIADDETTYTVAALVAVK
jgi:hypothetical protein